MGRSIDGRHAVDPALAFEDHGADERDGLHARKGVEFFEDAIVEGSTHFVFFEAVALEEDVGGEDVIGGEAFVEGGEMNEALGKESGEEQKGGAGEDLCSDEPATEQGAAARAGGAFGALKSLLRPDAKETKGGKDAADEGCSDGEEDGERKDGEVDRDGLRARDGQLSVGGEGAHGDEGECDAEDATGDGEKENFGKCALQDARCGCSKGGTDGGFAVASDEAAELRVGEVHAGDEQDAEDGGHQKPEARGGFSDEHLLHGLDVSGEGAVGWAVELGGRNLTSEGIVECVEVFLCLRDRDAGFESSEGDVVAVVAVESEVVEVDGEGGEDFVIGKLTGERDGGELVGFGEVEVLWKDTDDLIGCAGDLNGSASDVGVGVIESLPEIPRENGDFFAARSCFFREEVATEDGLDAEDIEKIGKSGDLSDETWVVIGEADASGALLE